MNEPAAIPAAYAGFRTRKDGTAVLSLEVEPAHVQPLMALFGGLPAGCPVGLARITNEAAMAAHETDAAPESAPGGSASQEAGALAPPAPASDPARKKPLNLASKVALRCKEPGFQTFLWAYLWGGRGGIPDDPTEEDVVREVCDYCGVSRRSEIIEGTEAAERWRTLDAGYLYKDMVRA
jgi:hypothetical protein